MDDNSFKRPKITDAYEYEKRILILFGIYPLINPSVTQRIKWIIMLFINWFVLIVQFIAIMYQIYLFRTNLDVLVKTLYYATTHTCAGIKLINFTLKLNTLSKIEAILYSPKFNNHQIYQDDFVKNSFKSFNLFANLFRASCTFGVSSYALMPFISEADLPAPGIFPFDMAKYRFPLYVFEMIAMGFNAVTNSSIDTTSVCLMRIAADKFDLLKEDLSRIQGECDVTTAKILKRKVELHVAILRIVELTEDLFYIGILAQFMTSVGVICLTMFQISTVPFEQKFGLGFYFICMLYQVSMYCWFGNKITEKSFEVGNACYMSEWYECCDKIKKSIFLIMERAKRPAVLTAGKIFTLSLLTLVAILRSSFSYFTILQRLYEE